VLDSSKKSFRIGMTAPGWGESSPVQLGAQLQMVVYLSIESNHVTPGRRMHRLMARGRQIHNRKAAVA
jgi:hypothetical protein